MKSFEFVPKITGIAYTKLQTICNLAKKEVGGILRVEKDGNGMPIVTDVVLIKQEVSGGDFEMDEDALLEFAASLPMDEQQYYCGWMHKHPIQGWSGQDNATFDRIFEFCDGFCLGVVKQANGKLLWRLDIGSPEREGNRIIMETEDFEIIHKDKQIKKEIKKEMKRLVKEKVFEIPEKKTFLDGIFDYFSSPKGEEVKEFDEIPTLDELEAKEMEDYEKEMAEVFVDNDDKTTDEILTKKGFKEMEDGIWRIPN